MIDWIWIGDISLSVIVWIFSVVVILPTQLLLCFKAKSRIIRLTPIILLCVLTMMFFLLALNSTGWDDVGYIFFAIYAALMILMCGIGWGIWAVVHDLKKKHSKQL